MSLKKLSYLLSILTLLCVIGLTQTSCKTGYGCPAEEAANRKVVKKTKANKNRKSHLFDKDTRKRMKRS